MACDVSSMITEAAANSTVNNFPAVFGRVCLRPLSGFNFVRGVVICHVGRAGRQDLRGKLQPRGRNYNHAEVVSARVQIQYGMFFL